MKDLKLLAFSMIIGGFGLGIIAAPYLKDDSGHICKMTDCTQLGNKTFVSEYEEGTDGYLFDLTHYNHPTWTYEQCEDYIFGYAEEINAAFQDEPNSNCDQ